MSLCWYGHADVVLENPSRDEWLAARQQGIGGSDVAAIVGLDPYQSNVALWAAKSGKVPPHDAENEAARWGSILEGPVAEEAAAREGLQILDAPEVLLRHPDHPHMLATPDRFVVDGGGERGILEVKTTSLWLADDWSDGATPDRAALQLQHYLAVTGLRRGWIAALIGGQRLEVRAVEANDHLASVLIETEADFWADVQSGTMPAPLDGSRSTSDTLAALFAELGHEDEAELPDDARSLYADLLAVKAQIKDREGERARLENELKALLTDAGCQVGLIGGAKALSWKPQVSRRVSTKAVKAAHPDDWFDLYGEEAESLVFRTHSIEKKEAAA